MEELRNFRKINHLTQDQLGDFLGIKKSFISRVENGQVALPSEKFKKLLNNDMGWDVSVLQGLDAEKRIPTAVAFSSLFSSDLSAPLQLKPETSARIIGRAKSSEIKMEKLWDQNEQLKKRIADLQVQLDRAEKLNAEYWEMIKKLTEK